MDYKDSLNLPKTSFPMKGRLPELEPKLLNKWKDMDIYSRIMAKGQGRPLWVLHDGPPYANGNIHLGTALNKILKDIVVKFKTMSGFHSPYVPGWDCHGLPIEHKVDETLGKKKLELTKTEIRRKCRDYANKYLNIQREQFIRLGVLGEWDNPYLTMDYSYEAIIARELGVMALDGRLSRDVKPVLWCGTCKTALAEAEVEYQDHESDSIYVPFKLKDDPAVLRDDLSGKEVYLVIWTTTPWTIPANMGIAYNPRFTYRAYERDGKVYILEGTLAEGLLPKLNLEGAKDLGPILTAKLNGLKAAHPLYGRDSLVVPAMYVSSEQGTGLVHTAPGHGREDYETGLAFGLPIYSPLDDDARFTDEVKELEGKKVMESNSQVIDMLKERGALLAKDRIQHSYPHCWRCKNPVVFRATPQWFVSMEYKDLRKRSLEAIDTVKWIPARGRDRIYGMVESRPDWCVSRQRSWGVPITIFFCEECGQWIYTEEIKERIFELFQREGADAWFEREAKEILPEGLICPHCGGKSFKKETDILDVWFDSGSSFAAVCEHRDYLPNRADMYLEGSDQHRGWFHSSLLISVANRDGVAPYREVLTHGYVVDGKGKKMSKSLGNTVLPEEVIKKYGADLLRLWCASENYQDDIRVSNEIMDMLVKAYFNYRNTSRFLLGNLSDFIPDKNSVPLAELKDPLDRYALISLNKLIRETKLAYNEYAFHDVYHKVNNFMGKLSSFYLDILKDRLYTRYIDDPVRRGSQSVMWRILRDVTLIMAPVLSFTTEEIWSHLPDPQKQESVFLEDFPQDDALLEDKFLEEDMEALLKARTQVLKALEEARKEKIIGSSLDAKALIKASPDVYKLLTKYRDMLPEFFIVSDVFLSENPQAPDGGLEVQIQECPYPKCPRCWTRDKDVPEDLSGVCPKCQRALMSIEKAKS